MTRAGILAASLGAVVIVLGIPVPAGGSPQAVLPAEEQQVTPGAEERQDLLAEGNPLHLQIVHLIVNVPEPGLYQVAQVMHVHNAADRPFLGGPSAPDGRRGGLLVPLPTDGTGRGGILPVVRQTAQPLPPPDGGLDPAELAVVADGLLDTRPFPAGTRQVAVTYELVAGEEGIDVVLRLPYPTQALSLLVGGPAAAAVRVSAPELAAQEPQVIRDTEFRHWTARGLSPGAAVRFSLAPAGRKVDAATWALLGLALAILAAVAAAWRCGPGPETRRRRRDDLLDEILQLDRAHDLGRIDEHEYRERRVAALEEVLAIDERLEADEPGEA